MSWKSVYRVDSPIIGPEDDSNIDYSIPEPMTENQVRAMRSLIADEALASAYHKSVDLCANYVRKAIEVSHKKLMKRSLRLYQQDFARDYGKSLLHSGFRVIDEPLKKGDIAIFQNTRSSRFGHIQIFTGSGWVSDYKQSSPYPDYSFRDMVPVLYRFYGVRA